MNRTNLPARLAVVAVAVAVSTCGAPQQLEGNGAAPVDPPGDLPMLEPVGEAIDLSGARVLADFSDDATGVQGVFYTGVSGTIMDGPESVCY